MTDFCGTIISLLDRIGGSYPFGIASTSLSAKTAPPQQQHQNVSCIMVVGEESEDQRDAAVDFAQSVCLKGLELSANDYRIICADGAVENLAAYVEQGAPRIVVLFQGSDERISTKNQGPTTYIYAPSARQVVASSNLKRMLWTALKPFRRVA